MGAVVVVGAWLGWLVVNPGEAADPSGDAIFVHAGGQGERVQTGIRLLSEGVAPTLIVSDPGVPSGSVPPGLCGSDPTILCVPPATVDTTGEARSLATLVDQQGWTRVVIVSSEYHLRRAGMLDRSCTDAEIVPVAAGGPRPRAVLTGPRVREILALAFSWLFQRC